MFEVLKDVYTETIELRLLHRYHRTIASGKLKPNSFQEGNKQTSWSETQLRFTAGVADDGKGGRMIEIV